MVNSGLVLFGENKPGAVHLSYGKRSRIIDHAQEHGIKGLITLLGVRYTTARREARKAIELAIRKIGKKMRSPSTSIEPIFGGDIGCFDDFMRRGLESCPSELKIDAKRALLQNYGSRFPDILRYLKENPRWVETLGASTVIKAEVVHAVREEMAQKLEDVVLRRTELGTAGHPGRAALAACAGVMAAELAWTQSRTQDEVQQVERFFSLRGGTEEATRAFEQGTIA
jgi:glycerol-3-phosphate dehydrogenase